MNYFPLLLRAITFWRRVFDCGRDRIHRCISDCYPTVRLCAAGEYPEEALSKFVVPNLSLILVVPSLITCGLLQWLSNFSNLFRLTNRLTFGHGFLHRSLLWSLVSEGDNVTLGNILSALRASNLADVVSRQDRDGNTPLHVACQRGHSRCAKLLLEKAAKTR